MLFDETQAPVEVGERPQAQEIHLEQAQRLHVGLVPLDDGAARHRRILHGDQVGHRLVAQQEAAGMDREVAREVAELARQLSEVPMRGSVGVQSCLGQHGGSDLAGAGQELCQPGERGLGEAQRLADVAYRRASAVANDIGDHGGAVPAVLGVDVLDHLLAPLVHRCRGRCPAARPARGTGTARRGGPSARDRWR